MAQEELSDELGTKSWRIFYCHTILSSSPFYDLVTEIVDIDVCCLQAIYLKIMASEGED